MIADKAITYGLERPMPADVGIKKIPPVGKQDGTLSLEAIPASLKKSLILHWRR
jgi:hypothetical protein